jgi:hypothetical protein
MTEKASCLITGKGIPKVFKRILYILLIMLLAALVFQLARTFIFTRFIGNTNEAESMQNPLSADIPADSLFLKYLIVYDSKEANSSLTYSNLEKVLDYMKVDHDSIDISNAPDVNTDEYECIIFSFESLDLLGDSLSGFMEYVERGGTMIFAIRPVIDPSFRSISSILAISQYDDMKDSARGLIVEEPLIIGLEEFEADLDFIQNSSINAELDLDKDPVLYLSTYDKTPLLWETKSGKGKFIVFNGTMLNDKNNRGIISNIISLSRDTFIYPIANIKMVHIDDFPSPVPRGTDELIMEEFNRTIPQFYREVWWSDMIRLSKRYDLAYSGFVIENYGNDTEPPFDDPGKINEDNFLIYSKELLNLGGEIGLHGFNHQSLAMEGYIKQDLGYNSWKNQEDMEESLRKLQDFINSVLRSYTMKSYVPPSNILSDEGRAAVVSAVDDLEVIASVYLPNYEGDVYVQEFEVASDGIVEFPRISSGYYREPDTMWSIYNALNLQGIFSHFIHPDDILDPERNKGQSWSVMEEEFDSILSDVEEDFPWLKSYTISEGAQELRKYLDIKPYIEYGDNIINIYCEDFRPDAYFIMRSGKTIIDSENIEYQNIWEDAYLLTLKKTSGSITLEDD